MIRVLVAALFLALGTFGANAAGVLICYQQTSGLNCIPVSAANPLPVSATVSASVTGFQPSVSGARGTPLSVTTSDSSGTLPTGAVVLVSNPGANLMYCNVNGIAATTSDEPITSGGGWFAFTIPSGVTVLHCIATGGSTTANMVGGSGLPTGTGGGGGSGGGGAVYGPTAAGSAAANPPVLMGGTIDGTATGNVDNWKIASGIGYITGNLTQGGTALSGTNGLFDNILQGNAVLSATNGLYANLLQGNAVLSATNPGFQSITDGTNKAAVKAASTAPVATDPALVVGISPNGNQATAANQATNGATTTHTCSTGGFSELGCLGQIDDDIKGPLAGGTNTVGNVGSDPSSGKGTPTVANLALPATATTQIIALSGTTKIYVTNRLLMAGGSVNVTFKYGTGTNCGTGTTTLDGPWPLTAQAGFSEGNGSGPVLIVPAGDALCVTTDASVSGAVKLVYQQF